MEPMLTRTFSFRQEKGLAAVLVPGGALEALNSDEDKIRLVLNRRKGFIKLALRFGVNLVPTFSFGENFIYDQVKAEQGKEILFNFTILYLTVYKRVLELTALTNQNCIVSQCAGMGYDPRNF